MQCVLILCDCFTAVNHEVFYDCKLKMGPVELEDLSSPLLITLFKKTTFCRISLFSSVESDKKQVGWDYLSFHQWSYWEQMRSLFYSEKFIAFFTDENIPDNNYVISYFANLPLLLRWIELQFRNKKDASEAMTDLKGYRENLVIKSGGGMVIVDLDLLVILSTHVLDLWYLFHYCS